jgi:hypothetical protein
VEERQTIIERVIHVEPDLRYNVVGCTLKGVNELCDVIVLQHSQLYAREGHVQKLAKLPSVFVV